MSDVQSRLATALVDRYTVLRELGAGVLRTGPISGGLDQPIASRDVLLFGMGRQSSAGTANDVARVRGLSPSRLEQLKRDLALTPEERVRAAEETLRLDKLQRPERPRGVRFFDRYEDYLDYKFKASAGGE